MTAPQDPFRAPDGQPGPYGPPPGSPGSQPAFGDQAPAGYGQQGYGQQGSGQPGYGSAPPVRRNGFGIAAIVLGVLALLLFWTILGGIGLGIAAIVLGVLGRGRAKRGEASNGGLAVAGAVLGLLGLLASVALFAAGASFLASDRAQQLQQCLEEAQGDADAENACATEFGDSFTQ